jgi:hypothetical protein
MGAEVSPGPAVRNGAAAPCDPAPDRDFTFPVLPWRQLRRDVYRAALEEGTIQTGVHFAAAPHPDRPTCLFIHGAAGAPAQFAALAAAFHDRVNPAAFFWDDKARLTPSAKHLRAALLRLPEPVTIVAHSMGMLLPAYLGATDGHGELRNLAALYLNPLIGGSRYAGDFRALRWLRIGAVLQRLFLRPSFLDLAPESEFQQTICGRAGTASSFAAHTVLLFTEKRGREPDIRPARVPSYFGQTRAELLQRFGAVVRVPSLHASGHKAPLHAPSFVVPVLERLLEGGERALCRTDAASLPTRAAGSFRW